MPNEKTIPREKRAIQKWLRQIRDAAGLSQEQVAARVGVDRRSVVNWEGAGGLPNGEQFLRYLIALDVAIAPAPPVERLQTAEDKLDDLRLDVDRIVRALSLDESEDETQEPAQLLATVVSLEQQIARLLEALGGPDAARWLNGQSVSDGVGVATRAPQRGRR